MRLGSWLITCVVLAPALACQPADRKTTAVAPPLAMPEAAPADAPNANAARYGPHGVAQTPSPAGAAQPSEPGAKPGPDPGAPPLGLPAAGQAVAAGTAAPNDEAGDEMRGHPCHCGKTCHCGHCSGAVPGCHCHVKRADDKGSE